MSVEPKAELHAHLEGTAPPALAREMAKRYGVDLAGFADGQAYRWSGFSQFLDAYDRVAALFRQADDYRRLTADYLTGLSRDGAIYAELTVSFDHARVAGIGVGGYLDAVAAGAREAEEATGIVARLIAVGVRHLGPEAVEAAARHAAEIGHPLVTGFGLAGDERLHRPADFAKAFAIAREAGLGLTAHAGEFAGAHGVRETLDALGVTRIGHGVRAVEDDALLRRLAEERIVLEVCPASNVALGVYPSVQAHPLRALHEAGLRLTLNSDDPPFFATDLGNEYRIAAALGFTADERLQFTRNAVEAAFVDEPTRARLLDRLAAPPLALGAPGASE